MQTLFLRPSKFHSLYNNIILERNVQQYSMMEGLDLVRPALINIRRIDS